MTPSSLRILSSCSPYLLDKSRDQLLRRSFYLALIISLSALKLNAAPLASTLLPPISVKAINRVQNQEEPRTLERGQAIERGMAGGETHAYQIKLNAGQFARIIIEQHDSDVLLAILDPQGKKIIEANDSFGVQGGEAGSILADADGIYRIEVSSTAKEAAAGSYVIRVTELRTATAQDKTQFAAQLAFRSGQQLAQQKTADGWRQALARYEEALPLSQKAGDRSLEAIITNSTGEANFYLGDRKKALDYFKQAISIWHEIGDRQSESEGLNNLGMSYNALRDQRSALAALEQALKVRQTLGSRVGDARILNNLGGIYRDFGDKQKALDYYNQALPLFHTLGDRASEAATLNNMGAVYRDLGENRKAFELFNRALPLRRETKDRRGEGATLHNLGLAYRELGELRTALDYLEQAEEIVRALGDKRYEGLTLNSLGSVYDLLGEKQKALDYYNQGLVLLRELKDRLGEGRMLNNIGKVYDSQGERQKAFEIFNQALALTRSISDRDGEAQALTNIGEVNLSSGKTQEAADYLNQALTLHQTLKDLKNEARTLADFARLERERGNLPEARARIEAAIEIVETLRSRIVGDDLRQSYFATVLKYYDFYIDLLMRLHGAHPADGFDAAALEASERRRARSLLEVLGETSGHIDRDVDPKLLERERSLRQLLNGKAERQRRLLAGKYTEEQAAEAEKEIRALITEYQRTQSEILAASPHYASLTQATTLNLKEIQNELLDQDTLLLEYALGDEHSYLWAVTRTEVASFTLPSRAEVEASGRRVYELLRARQPVPGEAASQTRARLQKADADYQLEAARLSQMLLGPVASRLGNKRLLIVADGALQLIPFGALPEPSRAERAQGGGGGKGVNPIRDSQPLIVNNETVNLPSATTLSLLRREVEGRKPAQKMVAIMADPVFDASDPRVKVVSHASQTPTQPPPSSEISQATRDVSLTRDGSNIPRLPATRIEAREIASIAGSTRAMLATDFAANRSAAMSAEMGQYRIVHFATHGLLNSEHPELSGIILSLVDERGVEEDGFLRLNDIYNLRLPADLVVLSACSTGLGKEIKGEGLVGLTRGFMYAGTARVVASLWKVDDEATAQLMKVFYRKMLVEKMPAAAALRAAKVEMLRQARWRSPYYWSAFVLQGEWR